MGRTSIPYYEPPVVPWCLLGKVAWGIATTVKVPEHLAGYYCAKYGWSVLIRDSEFPVPVDASGTMPEIVEPTDLHVHQQRAHRYRIDADFWREEGA